MSKLSEKLSLPNLKVLKDIIKNYGGIKNSIYHLYRTDTLKLGKLVGKDRYGNEYYENNKYFFGRNRWVIYNDKSFMEYDASMVAPEWHNWLHYMTDDPPTLKPRIDYKWIIKHQQNPTGSRYQYTPYSTTPQKIKSWEPANTRIKINAK